MNDEERYRLEFAERGEEWMREQLALGRLSVFKANIARDMIRKIDQQREDDRLQQEAEDRRTSLRLARQANRIALGAIIVSAIALVFSFT